MVLATIIAAQPINPDIHPRIWEKGKPGNDHEDKYLFRSPASYHEIHTTGEKDWLYWSAEVIDMAFELLGYHYIPHSARYVVALTMLLTPCYVLFFIKCMMPEEEDEDMPRDSRAFERRFQKWEARR